MDHQPPPFFKRGPAPLARLSFYAMLSLALLFFDSRFQTLGLLRQGVSVVTHPLQQIAHAPIEFLQQSASYFSSITRLEEENTRLRHDQLTRSETVAHASARSRKRTFAQVAFSAANGKKSVAAWLRSFTPCATRSRDVWSSNKGQQDRLSTGLPVVDDGENAVR